MKSVRSEDPVPYGHSCDYTQEEQDILQKAREIIASRFRAGRTLSSPQATADFLIHHFNGGDKPLEHEVFVAVWLDNHHRVLGVENLFTGTVNGASVYPREVVKRALGHNAAAVIFAHNHPSGGTEPSMADRQITDRLKEALKLVDVRVLDHVIVGGADTLSFAERGLI